MTDRCFMRSGKRLTGHWMGCGWRLYKTNTSATGTERVFPPFGCGVRTRVGMFEKLVL